MASTLSTITTAASARTGYRESLVAAPVEIIARRYRNGETVTQISSYLTAWLGPQNKAATPEFVSWVTAQL